MIRYLAERIGSGALVLVGVAILVFFLFQLVRFNPAYASAGESASEATIQNINRELGLDLPVGRQLLLYLNDISPLSFHVHQSDARSYYNPEKYKGYKLFGISGTEVVLKQPYLGKSFQTGRPVAALLNDVLPNTLVLAFSAIVLASIIGIWLGVTAAVSQGSLIDRTVTTISVLGISFPSFFAAIVLQLVFAYWLSAWTGLKMTGNLYEADPYTGVAHLSLQNLILPAIALGVRPVAVITQITRSSMLDVLHADYIRTARAKGMSWRPVVFRHALKNALIPVITSITGWLASLLAGAFFIEVVFNYNGLGLETVNAVMVKDIPVASGAVLYIATVFVIINILTDMLYSLVDPRVSLTSEK